jgi:hypothetical protein
MPIWARRTLSAAGLYGPGTAKSRFAKAAIQTATPSWINYENQGVNVIVRHGRPRLDVPSAQYHMFGA